MTRTDFLDDRSLKRGTHSLDDYADFRAKANAVFEARNHNQVGDPDKPGRALVQIANEAAPPLRFVVGVDALKVVDDKLKDVAVEVGRWRELSGSTDF